MTLDFAPVHETLQGLLEKITVGWDSSLGTPRVVRPTDMPLGLVPERTGSYITAYFVYVVWESPFVSPPLVGTFMLGARSTGGGAEVIEIRMRDLLEGMRRNVIGHRDGKQS